MKRIRCSLALIALIASLSGLSLLQGMGAIANAASSQHASSVVGKLARSNASKPDFPCPVLGADC